MNLDLDSNVSVEVGGPEGDAQGAFAGLQETVAGMKAWYSAFAKLKMAIVLMFFGVSITAAYPLAWYMRGALELPAASRTSLRNQRSHLGSCARQPF
jgi:hypothetical protein